MTTRTKPKTKPPGRRAPPPRTARPKPASPPPADDIEAVSAPAPPPDDGQEPVDDGAQHEDHEEHDMDDDHQTDDDIEEAEERPWRSLTEDAPFDVRSERFLKHPPVELLFRGAVVVGRWGTHNTPSGGRAYAWIDPNNNRLCAFEEPEGWREIEAG